MEVLLIQHGTILLSLGTVQSQIGLFHQLTDLPRGINTADAERRKAPADGHSGRALFAAAKKYAAQTGYSFLQVKTVQMGRYKEYDDTNRFYQSLGFKELEVFPSLWDEWNPCQIYIMAI